MCQSVIVAPSWVGTAEILGLKAIAAANRGVRVGDRHRFGTATVRHIHRQALLEPTGDFRGLSRSTTNRRAVSE
jgi:hypothetical protein